MTSVFKEKGSILIFVLWVLSLLAIFSVSVHFSVRQKLDFIKRIEAREKLREIASSGVKKAIYVLNTKTSEKKPDYLKETWSTSSENFEKVSLGEGSFSVSYQRGLMVYFGMTDEDSKLDINQIKSIPILTQFFMRAADLTSQEAHGIAASIADWKDGDDYPDESGAESNYYKFQKPPYGPKSAPFDTLDELMYVKGMTPEIYGKALPYMTLDGSGKFNINTISNVVMSAMGFSDSLIMAIETYRSGLDGLERTSDDQYFETIGEVVEKINTANPLAPEDSQNLSDILESGFFDVVSKNFKIQSVAKLQADNSLLKITCVSDREGNILRWLERFQTA